MKTPLNKQPPALRSATPSVTALLAILAVLCSGTLPLAAHAAAGDKPVIVRRSGELPASGRVALRCGLAWINENSALFQTARNALAPLLAARNLSVADVPPSTLAALPANPYEARFALSQERGQPLMLRGGQIPGRIPPELHSVDPGLADYTLVLRFTLVRPTPHAYGTRPGKKGPLDEAVGQKTYSEAEPVAQGTLLAALGSVRGVGHSGYGAPAQASPPRPGYAGSERDHARGYGGTSPTDRDFWNRDSDLRARDFLFRYGEPPQVATPPSGSRALRGDEGPGLSGNRAGGPEALPPPRDYGTGTNGPGTAGAVGLPGAALEMECYALQPRDKGAAMVVWRAVVQERANAPDLREVLPGMIRRALKR